jgi:hypothetical protein
LGREDYKFEGRLIADDVIVGVLKSQGDPEKFTDISQKRLRARLMSFRKLL